MTTPSSPLPVAVIGAGPVGLAAAAHRLARGETPIVLAAGAAVGAFIRQWSHVRFFSPWKYTVDSASVALLDPTGWTIPYPESAPTGLDIVARCLRSSSALVGGAVSGLISVQRGTGWPDSLRGLVLEQCH